MFHQFFFAKIVFHQLMVETCAQAEASDIETWDGGEYAHIVFVRSSQLSS